MQTQSDAVALAKGAVSDAKRLVHLEIKLFLLKARRAIGAVALLSLIAVASMIFLGLSLAEGLKTLGLSPALSYLAVFFVGAVLAALVVYSFRRTFQTLKD